MPNHDATFILQLIAAIAGGLVIFNQAMLAFGKRKPPNPLTVSFEKRFVSKEDHDKHVETVNERLVTAARSRKEIHREIEGLKATKTALVEQNKAQTDALNLLSSDFRALNKSMTEDIKEILKRLPR